MRVFKRNILGRKFYIDEDTGLFSFNKESLKNDIEINFSEIVENFKIKALNIVICITNKCNLNCKYCFNKNKTNKNIDIEMAKNIITQLAHKNEYEKIFVDVSGYGEPLMNIDAICDINDYCSKLSNELNKEILVTFVTNGILLVPNVAKMLEDKGILFGVSIDGNMEAHNLNRNSKGIVDSYSIVLDNISKIKNRRYLGCAVTITSKVYNLLSSLLELNKYFNTISVKPIRDVNLGFTPQISKKWRVEYERVTRYIIDKIDKNDITLLKALLNGDDYFGKFIFRAFLNIKSVNRCDAGVSRICIDLNGDVFGCAPAAVYENLRINKFNSKESLIEQINENLRLCNGCKYFYLCGGQCKIETILNKGKLNRAMCSFKKSLIELSIYISLYCNENNIELYNEIISFCKEKQDRLSKNKDLDDFVNKNPSISFTEAKRNYDKLNPKY